MSQFQLDEEAIFDLARQIEVPEIRTRYLDQACGTNKELKDRVAELLQAHDQERSFFERPPSGLANTVGLPGAMEKPGDTVGPYKLLQRIGEGGFGVVYMAEQSRPVRRKVALKVIKPGMDTKEVVARFSAERQALAMMNHPNIARIYDGGETESGRPFFVMELVKGVPLTKFCDAQRLSTTARLNLFVTVCGAIQHAHQKGVIHRDIKPSNVLVTLHDGDPVPKVIDFGVSKAINQQLTEITLFTQYGQMVGTPQYMSPEQAEMSGLDIDTRSDIYSLGVLLYELLTGVTPLEAGRLRAAGLVEMQRLIQEVEPLKPSIRVSDASDRSTTTAKQRGISVEALGRSLQGELDWVVMKALDKDRNRRYDTAKGFARDIERHLADEPVSACPPTTGYILRKMYRRHRQIAVFGMVMLLLMFVSLLTMGSLWRLASRSRDTADEKEKSATESLNAANESLIREKAARKESERNALLYRQQQYVSDMNLAALAWKENNRARLIGILRGSPVDESSQQVMQGFERQYLSGLASGADGKTFPLERSGMRPQFSKTGDTLAVGLTDNRVSLYSFSIGADETYDVKYLRTIGAPHKFLWYPTDAKIMPNGKQILRVSDDGELIELTDLDGNQETVIVKVEQSQFRKELDSIEQLAEDHLSPPHDRVFCLDVTKDGQTIVAGTSSGVISVSGLGTEMESTFHPVGEVRGVDFTHDGSRLAYCTKKRVAIMDSANRHAGVLVSNEAIERSQRIRFCPDDSKLLVGTKDGQIQIYDSQDLKEIRRFDAHDDGLRDIQFSPDGRHFSTGGRDNVIKLWDWPSCNLVAVQRGRGSSCKFHPVKNILACVSFEGELFLWDLANVKLDGPRALPRAPISLERAGAEGEFLISTRNADYRWSATTDSLRLENPTENSTQIVAAVRSGQSSAKYFQNGSLIVRNDRGSDANEFRLNTPPIDLAGSGNLLLAGRRGGTPTLWNLATKKMIFELPAQLVNVHYALPAGRFSDDESMVAIPASDYSIRFFDTASGNEQFPLLGHNQGVVDLDCSPVDSDLWASASWDCSARIWDLRDRKMQHYLRHRSWVASVAFSPDGQRLATVSGDRTLKIWSVESGQQLLSIDTGMGHPRKVIFSGDGSRICVTANLPPSYRVFDANQGGDAAEGVAFSN